MAVRDRAAPAHALLERCRIDTGGLTERRSSTAPEELAAAAAEHAGPGDPARAGRPLDLDGLPVAGVEQARKLPDRSLPYNALMG